MNCFNITAGFPPQVLAARGGREVRFQTVLWWFSIISVSAKFCTLFFPRMPDLARGSAHSKRRVKGSRQLWRWAGVRATKRLWLHEPVFKVKRWVFIFLFLTDATLHTLLVCIVLFCTYYYYYYFVVFFFFWFLSDRAAFFYDTSWLFLTLEKKILL